MQILIGPHISLLGALNIRVRRDHVLEDALAQLRAHAGELRKPLKVTFLGGEQGNIQEEAVDEGARLLLARPRFSRRGAASTCRALRFRSGGTELFQGSQALLRPRPESHGLCNFSCQWRAVRNFPLLRNSVCDRSAGGVSKEFFQLLVREIFSADYGMFAFNEETREFWFSAAALEMGVSPLDFRMVGQVLGLAIFNGVLLDVHLPLVRAPLRCCECSILQLRVRVHARSHARSHARLHACPHACLHEMRSQAERGLCEGFAMST